MNPQAIRALRRRHQWTQSDLAARLGTDAVTISRWERGVAHPRPSAQLRLRGLANLVPDVGSMIDEIGAERVTRLLKRELLLSRVARPPRLAVKPSERFGEVDRMRREQTRLKSAAKL